MSPSQHLDWFADNTMWFLDLPAISLTVNVPACPGWRVSDVMNHLTYGVGLAYPFALAAAPDCTAGEAFSGVSRPSLLPAGSDVFSEFERTMTDCITVFGEADPTLACYTYEGPGVAGFWFRRAAIETTLHRMDVVEALTLDDDGLTQERVCDAVAESVEFALPLAARQLSSEIRSVTVRLDSSPTTFQLGSGDIVAEISGDARSVLAALWGRSSDGVHVEGNVSAANEWLSIVERAFAGR